MDEKNAKNASKGKDLGAVIRLSLYPGPWGSFRLIYGVLPPKYSVGGVLQSRDWV